MTITTEQLAEWKRLADEATAGEWESVKHPLYKDGLLAISMRGRHIAVGVGLASDSDMFFIVAARTAVPALLDEVAALRAQLAKAQKRETLGNELIAWAAQKDNAVFTGDDGISHCAFCEADESYNDDENYEGLELSAHDPHCLHLRVLAALASAAPVGAAEENK